MGVDVPQKRTKISNKFFIIRQHGCTNTKLLGFDLTNNSVVLSHVSCLGSKFKGWDMCFVIHQNIKHRMSWCADLQFY